MIFGLAVTAISRLLLVALFLPCSALDKLIDFPGAVAQAEQDIDRKWIAALAIVAALFLEVFMSLGVLTGIADRLAAFVLAGYCVITALLWKRFWATGDFAFAGASRGRDLFWDFLKNLAVAGGFMVVTFGGHARGADAFLLAPLSSTHPYAIDGAPR